MPIAKTDLILEVNLGTGDQSAVLGSMRPVDILTRRRHCDTERSPILVFGTDLARLHNFRNTFGMFALSGQ